MKIRNVRHPKWLKVPMPGGENFNEVRKLIKQNNLHTVCQSAHCPNIGECWSKRTATFMILGNICTRNCRFCAVETGNPDPIDEQEPERVAFAVKTLNLKYAVITSVTRDDLDDGGAGIFARTIKTIREQVPQCLVEVLIPDFKGSEEALNLVIEAKPDVLNHNVETVPELYSIVRPQADYHQSLHVIHYAHKNKLTTKSGMMLGMGETKESVLHVMEDLVENGCNILTLGQYLQPSSNHIPIEFYVTPEEFESYKEEGIRLGFQNVEAGPLVRSSYHADLCFNSTLK